MIVCVGGVSALVVNVTCPLAFTAVGNCRMFKGRAQLAPSMKITVPTVTGLPPLSVVDVNVVDPPYVVGLTDEATVVAVVALLTV